MFQKPELVPEIMLPDGRYRSPENTPEFHQLVEKWTWGVSYGEDGKELAELHHVERPEPRHAIDPPTQPLAIEGIIMEQDALLPKSILDTRPKPRPLTPPTARLKPRRR